MRIILAKREARSQKISALVPVISFFVSLVLGGIVLAFSKANPFITYAYMFKGAFGSWIALPRPW